MSSDVVVPKNNEAEFVEISLKLGYKKLYFLYDFDDYNEEKSKKRLEAIDYSISTEVGFIVNQKNLNKAYKISKFLVAKSSDKDRFFIESGKIKIIYGFEELNKKDYLHQRASGLNHVLCDLAKKNNVSIGFSYTSLFNKEPIQASLLIGRMTQNISLCQKYGVKTFIGSFSEKPFDLRAPHDVMSLFGMLGMNRKSIKDFIS